MPQPPRESRPVWPHVALALWAALVLCAVTEPGHTRFAQRLEPFILGLPFPLAWVVGWTVASFLVFLAYDMQVNRRR